MGSGAPISAITAREEIMDSVTPGTIGGTYCGNPLACAATLKTMEIMKAEDFAGKAMHIGEKFMAAYEGFKEKYSVVGDVRGLGAMIGIEFVTDKESRTPYTEFVSVMIQKALQKDYYLRMQVRTVM